VKGVLAYLTHSSFVCFRKVNKDGPEMRLLILTRGISAGNCLFNVFVSAQVPSNTMIFSFFDFKSHCCMRVLMHALSLDGYNIIVSSVGGRTKSSI